MKKQKTRAARRPPPPASSSPALVTSQSLQIGKLTLPSWPQSLVTLTAACVILLGALAPDIGSIDAAWEFVLPACMVLLTGLLTVLAADTRWNRLGRTSVHEDRIEQTHNGLPVISLRWRDVLRQDTRATDVWLKTMSNRGINAQYIALEIQDGKGRASVDLARSLHPNGALLMPYRNRHALRRSFLLSLLRARPDLRIDADVYALCEVHPATLARDGRRKWFFRLGMAGVLGSALAGQGVLFWVIQDGQTLAISSILSLLVCLVTGAVLLSYADARLFPDPDDPHIAQRRHAALNLPP